jgi:hypothetical protein
MCLCDEVEDAVAKRQGEVMPPEQHALHVNAFNLSVTATLANNDFAEKIFAA